MRLIAFTTTTRQFCNKTKTVTRRLGWHCLQVGEILCAIEKGQGLKRGEHVRRLGRIRVVSTHWEPLRRMTDDRVYGCGEVILEGFPDLSPEEFIEFFCFADHCTPDILVNRIEFKYLD